MTFSAPKIVKKEPLKCQMGVKFLMNISIFVVIYQPLKLKIQPKVDILWPITMPKHFLNNSKTNSKQFMIRLFWPPKPPTRMPTYQNVSCLGPIFDLRALSLACWYGKKKIAKHIWKKKAWNFSPKKKTPHLHHTPTPTPTHLIKVKVRRGKNHNNKPRLRKPFKAREPTRSMLGHSPLGNKVIKWLTGKTVSVLYPWLPKGPILCFCKKNIP